ncbi:MAG TPA: hypothetical protein VF834_24820, partial [Streptosporangiaceae bacterium]
MTTPPGSEMGAVLMARSLRSPVVLMTAYVVIFWYAGPWLATGCAPHRNVPQVAVWVLLAMLAARGSRPARMLMIIYSAVGVLVILFGKPGWTAGTSERFIWLLACYLTQVGLLVRTPMYERTRLGWRPGQYPTARFLPLPRLWVALASGAAGVAMLLLPTQHFQVIACPAGHAVQRPPCLANGYGYPIAYRFTSGIFTMHGF